MTRASDIVIAVLLFCLSVALYSYHLGAMEFFRHTEADRTLIAWEMLETGNYLVPHLLHSPILTKPPLYYWMLATAISLFGAATEWVARFPSVLCAGFFAAFQYLFLRRISFDRTWALAGAAMLMTGASYQEFGTLAEIDMAFGFLSGVVFAIGYLSIERRSLPLTISTYLLLALAFLVKGPPSLGFYAVGFLAFVVWCWTNSERSGFSHEELRKIVVQNVIGALLGLLPVVLWASLLAAEVGWHALGRQVHVELVERIFGKAHHARGIHFYFFAFATAMLPWTFVIITAIWKWSMRSRSTNGALLEHRRFLVWNLCVVIPAILLLSLASGKSNRYLFPVYGPSINLALLALLYIRDSKPEAHLFKLLKPVSIICGIASLIAPLFVGWEGVSPGTLWFIGILFAATFFVLAYSLSSYQRRNAFLASCFLMLIAQHVRTEIVAPIRNASRSVRYIANEVHALVPPGQSIYTLELFDRWVNYYLKRMGRESYRVSPVVAAELIQKPGRVFLLLDFEEENWRFEKLKRFDSTAKLLKEFPDPREHLILVEAAGEMLYHLEPHDYFPTVPSQPY